MALPPGEQRDRDKLAASFIHRNRSGLADDLDVLPPLALERVQSGSTPASKNT